MLKLNNIFILTNLKNFLILEFKTAKKVKYSFLSFCKFKLFFSLMLVFVVIKVS